MMKLGRGALVTLGTTALLAAALAASDAKTNAERITLRGQDAELAKLSWMAGSWIAESGGNKSEEHWTHADAGSMLGVSRTIANGKTVFYEFLRIERGADGIVYHAAPKGRAPATPFTLTSSETNKAVFENPKHDFPKKITYWRTDDGMLHARVEGDPSSKQKADEYHWKPATIARD